jgi:hypothetical protein
VTPPPDTQVNVTVEPERGPNRTEFEVLKRDVQWLKYGVCVSAGSGVLTAALQLGVTPMPAAAAGVATAIAGLFR